MGIPRYVYTKDENGHSKHTGVEYEHVGCVLADRERNMYHDSDFYAVYWCEKSGSVKTDWYGTTAAYAPTQARVDATDEVVEKAVAWTLENSYAYVKVMDEDSLGDIKEGRRVRVLKGRKVKKGTVGTVLRIMDSRFDKYEKRVELETDSGRVWVNKSYLEVAEPELHRLDERTLRRKAWYEARERVSRWHVKNAARFLPPCPGETN